MKQILQNLKSGVTELAEVPAPSAKSGSLVIRTSRSLLSAGTERMLVEFGQANLLQKAKAQPDKVKQVLDKVKTDGLLPTLETVFNRLDEPLPLGYCNVGTVVEVGSGVKYFKVGDRVASNGNHAEFVCVPENLCAKIPDSVSDEEAAFTVLGSIGLQGVRLIQPELGQKVAVFGAGLIGLVVVQLLRASGCHVLAIDLDENRLKLAKEFGAEIFQIGAGDPVSFANSFSDSIGVDSVVITAAAKTDEIMHQAAQMCRKRGKIVLVGVVGLSLQRSDFYEKELTFQVSCSYGPGRYDPDYEQNGNDYPIGFVRWTEQRNFQAMLEAMAAKQIDVKTLITHRFAFEKATQAYELITGKSDALGVILEYSQQKEFSRTIEFTQPVKSKPGTPIIAVIGSGNFAKMTMVPALAKTGARLKYITARSNAAAAAHIARKFSFENATTDLEEIWSDKDVNTVFITTNHNSHASLLKRAIETSKNAFVEKPLCLNLKELKELNELVKSMDAPEDLQIMVGFNRRFSPHIAKIKQLLKGRSESLAMNMNANAGMIPANHWVQDPAIGGGRIIGEACHFIDLMQFLAESPVKTVSCRFLQKDSANTFDTACISLGFADGSIGNVNYFANGNKAYPKETLQIFSDGRILDLDNFKNLTGFGFKGFSKFNTWSQDKGHETQFAEFVKLLEKGGESLISYKEIVNATLASFAAVTSGMEERIIDLTQEYPDLTL